MRALHDGWTLSAAGGPSVEATVPGCVHLDLMAAGLIPDPYLDDNEAGLGWIGQAEWVYETTFDWSPRGERVDLECEGLDTVATIVLNGQLVAQTANMHRSYRFPVGELLRHGQNTLSITFGSVYRYTEKMQPRPGAYSEPFNLVRKMACNFGWDWGPTLVTAGIWRPIELREWTVARFAQVRPVVTADTVEVFVSLDRASDAPLVLKASVAGVETREVITELEAVVRLTVPDPQLWWPRGYGGQPLYDLEVSLETESGSLLDTWSRRIGFRTVRLDTTPDEHGSPYTVVVNETPIFVRGVNWIPDDCFPSRITRNQLAQRLSQACEANVNYLRVWGGGRYESEDFYDLADEMGLLVGQDFLFACAAYPEEEPLASEVAAEARDNIVRLASHPSLALWTGNNECNWGYADWGWPAVLGDKTWGAGYYFDLLPSIVASLDPTRPYWPSSPFSPDGRHPNDPSHGNMHIWDVWNSEDYLHYRDYTPRFVSEFGFQAPPTYTTLAKGAHQKAIDGELKLQRALDSHLLAPQGTDDWLYFTQVNQARAIAVGVSHFRSLMPVCMGSIVWQLNDCWPVTSWSAIDGEGRRKPMWYALRDAYADRLLVLSAVSLTAVNDSSAPWHAAVELAEAGLDGQVVAKSALTLEVPPRSVARIPLSTSEPILRAETPGAPMAWCFSAEDKDINYPLASFTAEVERMPDGYRVSVLAHTILRDLCLFPDRLDPAAEVDHALITLLPGETATFTVHTAQELDPVAFTTRPVLRCLNDGLNRA